MKKNIANCVAIMLIAFAVSTSANAQGIAMNDKSKENSLYTSTDKGQTSEVNRVSEVNSKILRNFYRTYGEKTDATWSKTDNGFAVSFQNNEMKTNVYYRNSGAIDYKINYYFEDQLPKEIRHLIKSNFYDYSITQVSEVHKDDSIGYYVKIEDKHSIKTVRIMNEEWEVVESLVKK